MRIAEQVRAEAHADVCFFPLSNECGQFLEAREASVRWDIDFPELMVSDLPEPHPFVDAIERHGCRHVGIRDLGLAQCNADVLIDGSITTITPYDRRPDRRLFTGPRYMVTSGRTVSRKPASNVAFVTLGGGASAQYTPELVSAMVSSGFEVYATAGFQSGRSQSPPIAGAIWVTDPAGIRAAMSRAAVAVSTSGVSLYELLAASVPTVAVSVNPHQLRTSAAFQQEGAIESLGPIESVSPAEIVDRVRSLVDDEPRRRSLAANGRRLVDGRGLFRVSEIVRKELCRKESN
jgi:spore coat polysaccharide biosynthesis predicted glycosyltransferase SpsG